MVDRLFTIGTGWLGWTPAVVWDTPIPQLILAMEGNTEWAKMTNPFGSGDSTTKGKKRKKPEEKKRPMSELIASILTKPGTKVYGRK